MKGNEILFQGSTISNQPPLGEEDKDDTTKNAETQNNSKFLIIAIFSDCFPLSI